MRRFYFVQLCFMIPKSFLRESNWPQQLNQSTLFTLDQNTQASIVNIIHSHSEYFWPKVQALIVSFTYTLSEHFRSNSSPCDHINNCPDTLLENGIYFLMHMLAALSCFQSCLLPVLLPVWLSVLLPVLLHILGSHILIGFRVFTICFIIWKSNKL